MTKKLMILGTSSGAGKSTIVTGLCRIFAQDGIRVAPFKAQNMTNNVQATADGGIIARSSVMAAQAAGLEPCVSMNPIVLQFHQGTMNVILEGRSIGPLSAEAYHQRQTTVWRIIDHAFQQLAANHDLVVIEGAGSPVEMNLKSTDAANLALAIRLDAPAVLVADVDRGGVFASVYGTLMLMTEEERRLVKGVILNRLQGDPSSFASLQTTLEEITGVPVVGLVPYLDLKLEDEDELTDPRTGRKQAQNDADQEREFTALAARLREHLDISRIKAMMEEAR